MDSYGAHGRFDARAKPDSSELMLSRNRYAVTGGLLALGAVALAALTWPRTSRG